MDYEPISVALKFAFLAVLYLFLIWVVSSARKDLQRNRGDAQSGQTGSQMGGGGGGTQDAWLVVERSDNLAADTRFDLFGGATLGRSSQADITFEDRYASSLHARVYARGDRYFVEDMNSTNGTLLNGASLIGENELADGYTISIGDTTFRFEMDI
ncbi:MAG: FHA domain-containing protein [Thermoleophilia bacterium]|nr:FHA domain-containing protein [Thermoleophilia bacterium]